MCSISTTPENCDNRKTFFNKFSSLYGLLRFLDWIQTHCTTLISTKTLPKSIRPQRSGLLYFGCPEPLCSQLGLNPVPDAKSVKLWIIQWLPCEFLLQVHENIWLIIEEENLKHLHHQIPFQKSISIPILFKWYFFGQIILATWFIFVK